MRTGLVVVSHSGPLARAALDLALQMTPEPPPHAIAAGLPEGALGTDATAVAEAIEQVRAEAEEVVVLMDLGSAVLSAELALELAGSDGVALSAAPLVEGLVAAAVAAAGGADAAEVCRAAASGTDGKRSQLGESVEHTEPEPVATADVAATAEVEVPNPAGLHLRPAAELARAATRWNAVVWLRNLDGRADRADVSSPTAVAGLGVVGGHRIEVAAAGPDADAAVHGVVDIVAGGFDELDGDVEQTVASPEVEHEVRQATRGAAPGIGIGPAWLLAGAMTGGTDAEVLGVEPEPSGGDERVALAAALDAVRADLAERAGRASGVDADIVLAHQVLVDDPALRRRAEQAIAEGATAQAGWRDAVLDGARLLEGLDDERQRARAADVRSVGAAVLRRLRGVGLGVTSRPGVLLAEDLNPELFGLLDPGIVEGVVLSDGSPTSHVAIMARGAGIPLVVGAGDLARTTPAGTLLIVDGAAGTVLVDPDDPTLEKARDRVAAMTAEEQAALASCHDEAHTSQGRRVVVAANVGSLADAGTAARRGADGIGLVRTELLLPAEHAPDVEEQVQLYRQVTDALPGRSVVFRTLDVGGDKPLGYTRQPDEANPYLGLRGLRLGLARPELLLTQLRALVRLAAEAPVSVMFPMVATAAEVAAARVHLERASAAEGCERVPVDLRVGIMVEVPAAALSIAELAPYVDFVSIGTNDLTQYVMAAERGNPHVAELLEGYPPPVERLVEEIATACRAAGVEVAVCGELAADPEAAARMVALGVDELSVAPPRVPAVKAIVRSC